MVMKDDSYNYLKENRRIKHSPLLIGHVQKNLSKDFWVLDPKYFVIKRKSDKNLTKSTKEEPIKKGL